MTRNGTPLTCTAAPIGFSIGAEQLRDDGLAEHHDQRRLVASSSLEMPRPLAICQLVIGG